MKGGPPRRGRRPRLASAEGVVNDAAPAHIDDDVEEEEDGLVVLDAQVDRQNACFARALIASVFALAAFLLVDIYAAPLGFLDISATELSGASGGTESGTLRNDESPGDLAKAVKDQFTAEDFVEGKGKNTPDHITKGDPRYDWWFKHHQQGGGNRPGVVVGFSPGGGTPNGDSSPGNAKGQPQNGNDDGTAGLWAPFDGQKWHGPDSEVTLQDGKMFEVVKQLKHDPLAFL